MVLLPLAIFYEARSYGEVDKGRPTRTDAGTQKEVEDTQKLLQGSLTVRAVSFVGGLPGWLRGVST